MFSKKQQCSDINLAVDSIINENKNLFMEYKNYKIKKQKSFSLNISLFSILFVSSAILFLINIPMLVKIISFILLLMLFCFCVFKTLIRVEAQVKNLFSKENIEKAFIKLNIEKNGRLSFIDVDDIICDKVFKNY